MWAGLHHQKRARLARDIQWKVRASCDPNWVPFEERVDVLVIATYRHHPVDSDNIVLKPYLDGLKGVLVHDDDCAHVRRVSMESRVGEEDRVEIVVIPVG